MGPGDLRCPLPPQRVALTRRDAAELPSLPAVRVLRSDPPPSPGAGVTGKLRLKLRENVLSPSCTCATVRAPQGLVQWSLKRGGPGGSQDAFSGAYEQKLFPY